MKKILVPTDFSECSYSSILYAANIARKNSAELYLLHIIENPEMAPVFPVSSEWFAADQQLSAGMHHTMSLMEDAKVTMERYRNDPMLHGIKIIEDIEIGETDDLINTAAVRYGIDLIIMCAYGSGGENDLFIGSNVEKVIRTTETPVITIKNSLVKVPEKIVFASDFGPEASIAFRVVRKVADIFEAGIHLVRINTVEKFETTRESRFQIESFIKQNGIQNISYTIYNDLMLESGLVNFCTDENADMIALGIHGRHGLGHFFTHSLTEGLIRHISCPVLTINLEKS
jgi:nucleotide-binding universal stress UspA family protein